MKKRSENCWLMHSRMVAAVATTSAQRHAAAQRAHPRDFGFLHVGMRVVELNPSLPARRRYRSQKVTLVSPETVFAFDLSE